MAVNEETSVYVGGLPYDADEDMLRLYFEPCGSIVSVKVFRPPPPFCFPYPVSPCCPSPSSCALLWWCDGASARRSVCFRREKKLFCFRISFCCRRFDAEARALPGSVAQNGGFVYVFLYDCVQRRACGVVG
jgi:hypothetical protein